MIKAVVFDIDDTLYNYTDLDPIARAALEEYALNNMGVSRDDFRRQHKIAQDAIDINTLIDNPARHDRLIRYMYILNALDKPLEPHLMNMYDTYWGTILDHMRPEPGLIPFMEALKQKGFFIATGSNMTLHMQVRKLQKLNVLRFIDRVVVSEETVIQKPHPVFFAQLSQMIDFKPKDILFIGDSLEHDIKPSTAAGMSGVWYNPKASQPILINGAPPMSIRSFEDCVKNGRLDFFGLI